MPSIKDESRWRTGGLTYLKEAGHFVVSGDDDAMCLGLDFPAFVVVVRDVPSTQPGLSLPVLQ